VFWNGLVGRRARPSQYRKGNAHSRNLPLPSFPAADAIEQQIIPVSRPDLNPTGL
jgi:hypothetical protein